MAARRSIAVRRDRRPSGPARPTSRFSSTVWRGTSSKCWCTMPMPKFSASAELRMATGRPSTSMRARIGGIGAEEDVHQAGLAGAVLAEEAEDVAGVQRQVDAGARLHRAEALGDAAHRDEGSALALSPLRGEGSGEGAGTRRPAVASVPSPPQTLPRKGEGSSRVIPKPACSRSPARGARRRGSPLPSP